MHDPDHIVFAIRRPWPTRMRPAFGSGRGIGFLRVRPATFDCYHCDHGKVKDPPPSYHADKARPGDPCPDCAGRGFKRVPLIRRLHWCWAFWRWGGREGYLPSLLTVWHHDPESDGTDSSCRNRYRRRWREAHVAHDPLRKWWWGLLMRRYDLLHVHHWRIQFDLIQRIHRWLFTRCEVCGERFPYGYAPVNVHGWGAKSWQGWLKSERGLSHGGPNGDRDCSAIASLRALKRNLPDWVKTYGRDDLAMQMQREEEPYYGSYPWWREAILGEDRQTAEALAAAHVQRSTHACEACGGAGQRPSTTSEFQRGAPARLPCEACDATGHPRVEHPVPAEAV